MNIDTNKNRRGFTLVELVIAFTVLSLILGAIGMVNLAGRDAYQEGVQSAARESRVRRALQRIANELTAGVGGTLTAIAAPTLQPFNPIDNTRGVSNFEFRTCLGYAAGAPLQSTLTAIRLESDPDDADDGIDNDGDGFVDERQLVLVKNSGAADAIRLVLLRNVAELAAGETLNMADDNGNGLIDEAGFTVCAEPGDSPTLRTLRLRLTLQGRDPKNNLVTRAVETTVHMRN